MALDERRIEEVKLLLKHLRNKIDFTVMAFDTMQEANSLAYTLLIKAIDILQAWHDSDQIYPIIEAIAHDRRMSRMVPVTEEHVRKMEAMKKFLP